MTQRVISEADEFKVILDENGMIDIIDGEEVIRVTMFEDEWDALYASYVKGDVYYVWT